MSLARHKFLYFRALIATLVQGFAFYLNGFLMVALGFFSDRRELLIRDLDEYGVKRSKGFAIYDITKTNKPYYASLRENAAEDEHALRENYIVSKEGEDHAKEAKGQASQADQSKKRE